MNTVQVPILLNIYNSPYRIQFFKQITQISHSRSGFSINTFGYTELSVFCGVCLCLCSIRLNMEILC